MIMKDPLEKLISFKTASHDRKAQITALSWINDQLTDLPLTTTGYERDGQAFPLSLSIPLADLITATINGWTLMTLNDIIPYSSNGYSKLLQKNKPLNSGLE